MIREGVNGFCMALADSVPGVSGGTVAFIMGFYDRFIGSIDGLVFGRKEEKRAAVSYLIKLGIGWGIGMILAVFILANLFESRIYMISSLFIGFIAGSIPLILKEEWENFRRIGKGLLFGALGIVLVVLITWLNGRTGAASMDLGQFSLGLGIRLFLIGMVAISAMFLPGISGSTLLLIFGAYIPVISAVKGFLTFKLSYFPALVFFGCGILAGAVIVVKGIKVCLEKFRTQSLYAILGMMVGSLYAIVMGPTTLEAPRQPLTISSFQILPCVLGAALVLGMQLIKERRKNDEA